MSAPMQPTFAKSYAPYGAARAMRTLVSITAYLARAYLDVPFSTANNQLVRSLPCCHWDPQTKRWFIGAHPNDAADSDSDGFGPFSSDDDADGNGGGAHDTTAVDGWRIANPDLVLIVPWAPHLRERCRRHGGRWNPEIGFWLLRGNTDDYANKAAWFRRHNFVYDTTQARVDLPHLNTEKNKQLRKQLKKRGAKFDAGKAVWFIPAGTANADVRFAQFLAPAAGAAPAGAGAAAAAGGAPPSTASSGPAAAAAAAAAATADTDVVMGTANGTATAAEEATTTTALGEEATSTTTALGGDVPAAAPASAPATPPTTTRGTDDGDEAAAGFTTPVRGGGSAPPRVPPQTPSRPRVRSREATEQEGHSTRPRQRRRRR